MRVLSKPYNTLTAAHPYPCTHTPIDAQTYIHMYVSIQTLHIQKHIHTSLTSSNKKKMFSFTSSREPLRNTELQCYETSSRVQEKKMGKRG